MIRRFLLILLMPMIFGVSSVAAHSIHYRVEPSGISARVFFGPDDPAAYSAFEIFGPGDSIAHQKGRTDRHGVVAFLPDRPGSWRIKVIGEADHGAHAVVIDVHVNASLYPESFSKPLVAQYLKAFIGISIVLFIFSVWVLARYRNFRRPVMQEQPTADGSRENSEAGDIS
jgi:nickel transport protein